MKPHRFPTALLVLLLASSAAQAQSTLPPEVLEVLKSIKDTGEKAGKILTPDSPPANPTLNPKTTEEFQSALLEELPVELHFEAMPYNGSDWTETVIAKREPDNEFWIRNYVMPKAGRFMAAIVKTPEIEFRQEPNGPVHLTTSVTLNIQIDRRQLGY